MKKFSLLLILLVSFDTYGQNVAWYPLKNDNNTIWADNLDVERVLSEYPRPSMVRENWMNLNGIWSFTITESDDAKPSKFDRQVLVPFPIESTLSGVNEKITPGNKLWYKRNFIIPEDWSYRYILLHVGASDWETKVYINGEYAGIHRGGYDPFSLDITFLLKEKGRQEITIEVWDPTDEHYQPRGKQKLDADGEWHTPASGIWQTVWIEPVMWASIKDIKILPDVDKSNVKINVSTFQAYTEDSIICTVLDKGEIIGQKKEAVNDAFEFGLENAKLWSPKNPHLYQLGLTLVRNGQKIDSVSSYFGMRKISIEEHNGKKRIHLNNRPVFSLGITDQGYWPDGLYTAPSDEAMIYDIFQAKSLGYNTIRKSGKVEPERWYYHCDRLGMMVWQDIPNGGITVGDSTSHEDDKVSFASESQFKLELEAIINSNFDHPSITAWLPFVSRWDRLKTMEITHWAQSLDSTRLIGSPAGSQNVPGMVVSQYSPQPTMPQNSADKAEAVGAYGGIYYPTSLIPVSKKQASKYLFVDSSKELTQKYLDLTEQLIRLMKQGLSGAVYYQLTDVENEANGLISSDRKKVKISSKKIRKAHQEIQR